MKAIIKRTMSVLLLAVMLMSITAPTAVYAKGVTMKVDKNTAGMTKKEAKVYKKLVAMKAKIPEGTEWTNKMYYKWNGGVYRGGYGCSAFAFKLSDKAFGKKKVRLHKSFAKIRVGDIVRMDNNRHSVVVLKVKGEKYLVAEGNYNGVVHWGRIITLSDIQKTGTYVMTRY